MNEHEFRDSLKIGDRVFWKYPDANGSPIECGVIFSIDDWRDAGLCIIDRGCKHGMRPMVPIPMLFQSAREAYDHAESKIKSLHHGIFGDYNRRMLES